MLEQVCSSPFSSLFPFDHYDHDEEDDDEDGIIIKNLNVDDIRNIVSVILIIFIIIVHDEDGWIDG